jgi:signal transduction histidine kinase
MRSVGQGFRFSWRIFSLATLALVVLALAILQYRWINELSEAQESRAVSRLREETRMLADALDTEVTRGALAFEIPTAQTASQYAALERAWETWNRNADWPRIVSGVSLLEADHGGWRVRSLGAPASFDLGSVLEPDHSAPVRLRTNVNQGGLNATLLVDGHPAFLRPAPIVSMTLDAPQMNWILIRFDETYLAATVLPRLLEERSTADDRSDFAFEIEPRAIDARHLITADVLHYRPDCLTTPVVVSTQPSAGVDWGHGLASTSNGVSTTAPGPMTYSAAGQGTSLNSVLHAVSHCQIPLGPSDRGLMQISVRSRQGSWSGVFMRFRKRNEFVSIVVLATLLAALAVLIVSTERARKLAQMQTVVAAGISHELRTPLASLRVAADDLKKGLVKNQEEACQYGEVIETQSRRLEHMVNQALAFARSTQPETPPRRCAVSVAETFNAVFSAVAQRAAEANIELERRIAPGVPGMLADPESAFRCLTNLVENSIKYAGDGRWILLAARPDNRAGRSFVEVTVEDRGPGIPDDERTAVFEPFYRGSSARRSRWTGSGLGLAIVKNSVEANGGSIQLEQAVPHGCKFRLFFPAAGRDSDTTAKFEVTE